MLSRSLRHLSSHFISDSFHNAIYTSTTIHGLLALTQEDLLEPNKTSATNSSIHDIRINQSSSSQIWCYGLLLVTVRSFMAVFVLCFLPLISKSYHNYFLTTVICCWIIDWISSIPFDSNCICIRKQVELALFWWNIHILYY